MKKVFEKFFYFFFVRKELRKVMREREVVGGERGGWEGGRGW